MHRSGLFSVARYEDDDDGDIAANYDNINASLRVESSLRSSKKIPTCNVCLKLYLKKTKLN